LSNNKQFFVLLLQIICNMLKKIKKILRRNKLARKIYFYFKKIIIWPLKFTPLKPIANTGLPLKELFNLPKVSLLNTVAPYSLLGYKSLENVYNLTNEIEKRKLNGSYVECGVWKGGCAAIMGAITKKYNSGKITWYFDSFEGMPEPSEKDARGSGKKGDVKDIMGDVLKASVLDVEEIAYKKLSLPKDKNIIVKGWFKDTLPLHKEKIGKIAILRLDGDWYESTMTALKELYDQVVVGGYVIIDDYGAWEGCRRAVHEFAGNRNIKMNLKFIGTYDPEAFSITPPAYFQKVDERKD